MPDHLVDLGHVVLFFVAASNRSGLVLRNCAIWAKQSEIGLRDLGQTFQDRSSLPWDTCAFSLREAKDILHGEGGRVSFAEGVEFKFVYHQLIGSGQTVTTPTLPC